MGVADIVINIEIFCIKTQISKMSLKFNLFVAAAALENFLCAGLVFGWPHLLKIFTGDEYFACQKTDEIKPNSTSVDCNQFGMKKIMSSVFNDLK